EALAELARRYFTSHGPATERDFAWWTGLSLGEARRAIAIAGKVRVSKAPRARVRMAALLPAYDEYTVAYRDRSAFLDPALAARMKNGIFSPVVLVDGRIAGTWKRGPRGGVVTDLVTRSTPALADAIARFEAF